MPRRADGEAPRDDRPEPRRQGTLLEATASRLGYALSADGAWLKSIEALVGRGR